jgi:hypothetical protein
MTDDYLKLGLSKKPPCNICFNMSFTYIGLLSYTGIFVSDYFFWIINSLYFTFLIIDCYDSLGVSLTLLSPPLSLRFTYTTSTKLNPRLVYINRFTSPINDFSSLSLRSSFILLVFDEFVSFIDVLFINIGYF